MTARALFPQQMKSLFVGDVTHQGRKILQKDRVFHYFNQELDNLRLDDEVTHCSRLSVLEWSIRSQLLKLQKITNEKAPEG